MSDVEDQIQSIHKNMPMYKAQVELRDAILRLSENADFRIVFEKKFMEEETLRAARSIGDPNLDAKMQMDMVSIAAASGHVRRFLSANIQMGNQAEKDLVDMANTLEELESGVYSDNEGE